MKHSEFKIGCEFTTANGDMRWRCTDIGTRVIVAVAVEDLERYSSNGPPYEVSEYVFDEYDLGGCDE